MVCESWQAPEDSVSHGLCKKRLGGVSLYKYKYLGTALTWVVWKIASTLLPVVDKSNHLSKQAYSIKHFSLFYKIKSSSTCLIPASLCEGPFFYFNVESPSSCFMHQLREHSGHSEFNVHCPKVIITCSYCVVTCS
jgi:hypothetical protein